MDHYLENSIARDVLRLALQIAPTLAHPFPPTGLPQPPRTKDDSLRLYRQRLVALDRGLTVRELDVCARSLLGMTAEGTALELGVKQSSVVTYRKRAYARLGISSQSELFRLIG